jgi:quercetin dioxygenase-like cupin family protein
MIQSKVWGTTEKLFSTNNVEIHRINIKKGGYCSRHFHRFKYNQFYVESGLLDIKVEESNSQIVNTTTLYSGFTTTVEPNKLHMFVAKENTIAYEIYWTQLPEEDIVRKSFGGIVKFENDIYTGRYFRKRVKRHHPAQIKYGQLFYNLFKPKIVYDVGCGLGSYLIPFKQNRCNVLGFDKFFDQAKPYCDKEIVGNILNFDVLGQLMVQNKSDLTLCIDLAQIVPPDKSSNLINNLCNISNDYIIFVAAKPGQNEIGYINCRDPKFWIDLFGTCGFGQDIKKQKELTESININDSLNLTQNIIVIRKII